jgi:uncharacterized protein YqeY
MTVETDPATAMKQRVRDDLRAAMRERRAGEVEVLRCLLGALDQAEAVAVPVAPASGAGVRFGDPGGEVPRKRLSAEDVLAVIRGERDENRAAAQELLRRGRGDAAEAHLASAALLEAYLG